jgi:hypothetical protein
MRMLNVCLLCSLVVRCFCDDFGDIRDSLRIEEDGGRAFITTNTTSMPFYLVAAQPDFPAMIGTKLDTNVISTSRMAVVTQYVPSAKRVDGRIRPTGYLQLSGRYAVLTGRTLTLSGFNIQVAHGEEASDGVLLVESESLSVQVPAAFAAEAERLRASLARGMHR